MEKYSRIELMCRPDIAIPDAKFICLFNENKPTDIKWVDLEYEKSMFIEVSVDEKNYDLIKRAMVSADDETVADNIKMLKKCSVYTYANDANNTCRVYNVKSMAMTVVGLDSSNEPMAICKEANKIWLYVTVE